MMTLLILIWFPQFWLSFLIAGRGRTFSHYCSPFLWKWPESEENRVLFFCVSATTWSDMKSHVSQIHRFIFLVHKQCLSAPIRFPNSLSIFTRVQFYCVPCCRVQQKSCDNIFLLSWSGNMLRRSNIIVIDFWLFDCIEHLLYFLLLTAASP